MHSSGSIGTRSRTTRERGSTCLSPGTAGPEPCEQPPGGVSGGQRRRQHGEMRSPGLNGCPGNLGRPRGLITKQEIIENIKGKFETTVLSKKLNIFEKALIHTLLKEVASSYLYILKSCVVHRL